MKNRILVLGVLILLTVVTGCSSIPATITPEMRRINRENLEKLSLGITKSEVLEIMGSPQGSATFPRYAKHLDYWMYHTDISKIYLNKPDEYYTYLAFENSMLVGVGAMHEVIPFNNKHPLWKP